MCINVFVFGNPMNKNQEVKGVMRVQKQDLEIYKSVQKNAEMGMKAIDIITDKVHDAELSRQLSRQGLKYSELRNRAKEKLLEEKAEPYRGTYMQDMMLATGIHANTMLNTSSSHIAELVIQGSNRGITDMCKTLNHNRQAERTSVEFAKELMDFEEKNIERLKTYL